MKEEKKDNKIVAKTKEVYYNTILPTSESLISLFIVFLIGFLSHKLFGINQGAACFIVIAYWIVNIVKVVISPEEDSGEDKGPH